MVGRGRASSREAMMDKTPYRVGASSLLLSASNACTGAGLQIAHMNPCAHLLQCTARTITYLQGISILSQVGSYVRIHRQECQRLYTPRSLAGLGKRLSRRRSRRAAILFTWHTS